MRVLHRLQANTTAGVLVGRELVHRLSIQTDDQRLTNEADLVMVPLAHFIERARGDQDFPGHIPPIIFC